MRLDKGEQPKEVDVIIVPEGASIRAYRGVDLLLDSYSHSNQLNVSSTTAYNVPNYLEAGAESEQQLILEENSTSTWTNATNSIDIMEENN